MSQDILKRNNVILKGQGHQIMLFAHGFGCDQNMWRFVTPAFEEEYKVVLFDYVGCGKSDTVAYHADRYASLHGYAQDVLEICAALEAEEIIFVGHSVSAMIGLLAAVENPDIFSCMIFIGPSARYLNDVDYMGGFSREDLEGLLEVMENNFIGWANFLAPVVMKNEERAELTQELKESFCSTDPVITRRFAEVTFFSDNREDLSNLTMPCLILQCSDDAIAPEEVGLYIHHKIKGSTFEKMNATGHCPHMSDPEETVKLIQKFLNQTTY